MVSVYAHCLSPHDSSPLFPDLYFNVMFAYTVLIVSIREKILVFQPNAFKDLLLELFNYKLNSIPLQTMLQC